MLDLPLHELAHLVRRREASPTEVVTATLARIDAAAELGAVVATDPERSLADAAAVERRLRADEDAGVLAGIPLAVKDTEDVAGWRTTHGSPIHADDPPALADSALVARLRAAGCVVVAKTNTPEFAFAAETDNPVFGPTRNPWNLERSAGGSSGGSAAALAGGLVRLATGSDGGGSIRIPASLCGLVGFKPSHGRVPAPETPTSGLLSAKGPMTTTLDDLVLALSAVVGPDASDPFSLPPPHEPWGGVLTEVHPPRRALWAPSWGYPVDAGVARCCAAAIDRLSDAGTEIVEIDEVLPGDPVEPWFTIWASQLGRRLAPWRDHEIWEQVTPELRAQATYGMDQVSGAQLAAALDACWSYTARLAELFHRAPVLLCPTVAGRTPQIGGHGTIDGVPELLWVRFTYPFNLTRNPAGSVPVGLDDDGLPVGLQVIGPHHADVVVLRVMAAIDRLHQSLVGPLPGTDNLGG